MARVAVVTDSTADIPPDLLQQFEIRIVPLSVQIGSSIYLDRVTIKPAEFMVHLASSGEIPTTSQPSVGRFQQMYNELADDHDGIISIHISSRLSGTYQSACWARDSMNGRIPIAIIDSRSASMGLGFPVLMAAKLAGEGQSLDQIERAVIAASRMSHVMFLVDTLEYLRRGGRIGRAAEIVGSILQLKPILRLEEGIVVPFARTRTRPKAAAGLLHLVKEFPVIGNIAIMAVSGTEDVDRFIQPISEVCPSERIVITELSPVLAAHIGPRGLGVAVFEGEPIKLRKEARA